MKWALCGLAAILLAAGCSRNVDTPEAVKRGVIHDLSKKMDVQNMDVSVDSVSFRDREADAVVSFAPKGAPRQQGMSMRYRMQRSGDEWHIASRSSGDLQHHAEQQTGAEQQMGAQNNGALPAGHPSIGSEGAGGLPAGHPAVPSGETR
jgi:hypothetical protein